MGRVCSGWGRGCYQTIDENYPTNINYPVSNAAAMALMGKRFSRPDFLTVPAGWRPIR
jgi:hypothetical protein